MNKHVLVRLSLLGILTTGLHTVPAKAGSTLEALQTSGSAKIGFAQEAPYTMFSPSGEPTGAAVDVAMAVLAKLKIGKVTAEVVDWGALVPGLGAKRFDLVSTGMYIRPQRCSAVRFSQPDLCTVEGFAVKKSNPSGLHTYADLIKPGIHVAVCGGCTEQKRATEVGVPSDRIVVASDAFDAVAMLQAGRVDAAAWPDLTLNATVKKVNDVSLTVVSPVEGEPINCAAAAFNYDDAELRDAYDAKLAEFKASGQFAKLVKPYGFDPELATNTNRDTLCKGPN